MLWFFGKIYQIVNKFECSVFLEFFLSKCTNELVLGDAIPFLKAELNDVGQKS